MLMCVVSHARLAKSGAFRVGDERGALHGASVSMEHVLVIPSKRCWAEPCLCTLRCISVLQV